MTFLPRCGECAGCATGGRMPCGPGSASNAAGELLGGGRRLSRDGVPVHHHLGVSAFATHAVVDARSVVAVDDDVPVRRGRRAGLRGPDRRRGAGQRRSTRARAERDGRRPRRRRDGRAAHRGGPRCRRRGRRRRRRGQARAGPRARRDLRARPGGAARRPARGATWSSRPPATRAPSRPPSRATAPGGRTVTVGLPPPDALASISPLQLVAEARTVMGSYLGSAVPSRDIPVFAQWWREGRLPVEALVSSRISLDDINLAMDELRGRDGAAAGHRALTDRRLCRAAQVRAPPTRTESPPSAASQADGPPGGRQLRADRHVGRHPRGRVGVHHHDGPVAVLDRPSQVLGPGARRRGRSSATASSGAPTGAAPSDVAVDRLDAGTRSSRSPRPPRAPPRRGRPRPRRWDRSRRRRHRHRAARPSAWCRRAAGRAGPRRRRRASSRGSPRRSRTTPC